MKVISLSICFSIMQFLILPVTNAFAYFENLFNKGICYELFNEHRIGRFAIDIPAEAALHYRQDKVDGMSIAIAEWDHRSPIHAAFKLEWERRIDQIKVMDKHKNVDNIILYERTFHVPEGDIKAVLYYGNSTFDDLIYCDLLLNTQHELVWFSDSGMQEYHQYILEDLLKLARSYRNSADDPSPDTFPWFHLQRGMLRVPFKDEETTEIRLIDHPLFNELEISIETNHVPEKSKSLLKAYSLYNRLLIRLSTGLTIRKLRASRRTLAGMTGEEVIVRVKEKNSPTIIRFEWSYRGKEDSMEHPEIRISMESGDGDYDKKIDLWDQMLDSFHFLGNLESEDITMTRTKEAPQNPWSYSTSTGLKIYRASSNLYGLRDVNGQEILGPEYPYIGEFQNDMLIAVKRNGDKRYMGLLDRNGKWFTAQNYSRIGFFKDGLSIVKKHRGSKDVEVVMDLSGKIITREEYYWIDPFRNGFATVHQMGGKGGYGFINRRGERITSTWYDWVENFSEGRAVVSSNKNHGIIDEQGHRIGVQKYSRITNFKEGRAVVMMEWNKEGYIDREGHLITPLKYYYAEEFSKGVARVGLGIYHGFIDINGKEILPIHFDGKELEREGVPFLYSLDNHYGAVDLSGKTVIPFQYRQLFRLGKNLIRAIRKDEMHGVLDENANIIVPFDYAHITNFCDGILKVYKNFNGNDGTNIGLLTRAGRILIPPLYDAIEELGPNHFLVKLGSKQGIFDHAGKLVVPVEYDQVTKCSNQFFKVKIKKYFGLLDLSGNISVPIQYDDDFRLFDAGNWIRVRTNGKYGLYYAGKLFASAQYDYLFRFDDGFYVFRVGKKWGSVNQDGQQIGLPQYQYIGEYHQGVARAKRNGKWGYLDTKGKVAIPFIYDYASDFTADRAYVREKAHTQWKTIKLSGNI